MFRENQYEIIYEILNDDGKLLAGGLRRPIGKEKLDNKSLDILFANTVFPEFEEANTPLISDIIYTKTEIENILISKGLIAIDETIEDLKSLTELTVTKEVIR